MAISGNVITRTFNQNQSATIGTDQEIQDAAGILSAVLPVPILVMTDNYLQLPINDSTHDFSYSIAYDTASKTLWIHDGSAWVSAAPGYLPYVAKTGTYGVSQNDYTIDCTSGTFTVTLPTAVGYTGKVYIVKNSGAGTITLATSGGQTIDGAGTKTIAAAAWLQVQSNGANWIIIG